MNGRGITDPRPIHTIPLQDFRPHVARPDCWCRPRETQGGICYVHHALDQREQYETGELRPH